MDGVWMGVSAALEKAREGVLRGDGGAIRRGCARVAERIEDMDDEDFTHEAGRLLAEAIQDGFEMGWRETAPEKVERGVRSAKLWPQFPDACSHLALTAAGGPVLEGLVSKAIQTMARSAIGERVHLDSLKEKTYGDAVVPSSSFCSALATWSDCKTMLPEFDPEARIEVGLMLMAWEIDPAAPDWERLGLQWLGKWSLDAVSEQSMTEAVEAASRAMLARSTAERIEAARVGLPSRVAGRG